MDMNLLQRLTAATTDAEREAIVLEMSLSALSATLQEALQIAAIPHWFDSLYLEALLGKESDTLYDELLAQSFIEQIPGKGYAVHQRTRRQLLHNLWRDDSDRFRTLSGRAADYCEAQANESDNPEWQAEAIYHRLVSDPADGVDGLRNLATKWANYEYHSYSEIERALRWANEQLAAGRLTGSGADWTRLWQAKLALIYGRPDQAASPLNQIATDPASESYFAAETAQTRGDVFAKTGARTEMETAWHSAYDLYLGLANGQGELDAYLVADKMRQHGLTDPEEMTVADPRSKTPPSHTDLKLIENISTAWIDGVLKTALDETIDLRMDRSGGQPANLVYHQQRGVDRAVAAGHRLSRLFDSANRSLLILGAPGSGKTITLLQLLDELLQEARHDADAPIPLLFNLSSFGVYIQNKGTDLPGWLAKQAYDQYRLKRETTRKQLTEADKFTLLLDGLDEVPEANGQREQCVQAINRFMQAHPCGLIVCSRIGDYEALQNKLMVNNALVLQPLTNQQMESFIAQAGGEQAEAMLQRIQADWQLREALRSPLLLNLYPQSFVALETAVGGSRSSLEDTIEQRRKEMFAAYVDTIFSRPEKDDAVNQIVAATKEKSMHWLSFLGNRMQQAGNSLFFIEEMQPTWLPRNSMRRYRGVYGLYIGAINGLIVAMTGVLTMLLGEETKDELFLSVFSTLAVGLIFSIVFMPVSGAAGGMATWLTSSVSKPKLRAGIGGLLFTLIGWLLFSVIDLASSIGPSAGLGIIISVGILPCWVSAIELRERVTPIRPSQRRIFQYAKRSVFYGLIFGIGAGLSVGLSATMMGGDSVEQIGAPLVGLIFGLIFGLSGFILAFLDTPAVDKRPIPEGGVWASLVNGLRMTLLAILFFGLPVWIIDQAINGNSLLLSLVLINILPPTFTWFGGLAWCQHKALRRMISKKGWLPSQLVEWLDSMAARGLLRRVGGGYIFIHRSLLEYFAELEEW